MMTSLSEITVEDKIKCLRRELILRERVYPGRVADGRMKQGDAEREMRVMKAILDDYQQGKEGK